MDAQDVFQDAIVKTWRSRTTDAPPADSHVYRSIRQCAIDLGRKLDRRQKREQKAEAWFSESDASSPATGAAEGTNGLLPDHLEHCLGKLSPEQREVLTLKIWGEQTFEEIAHALELSPNTAASRYRYAIKSLKRQLEAASTSIPPKQTQSEMDARTRSNKASASNLSPLPRDSSPVLL